MNFYAFFFVKCFWLFAGGVSWATATTTTATAANCCDWFAKVAETRPLYQRGSLSLRSLSFCSRALSLSLTAFRSALSLPPHLSFSLFASCFVLCKLLATLFECLVVSAFKTFQFAVALSLYALTLTRTVLSHSFSLSVSLSVSLQSLLSFCKNGCLCCACSLSVGVVVVVAVGRNTVELEQQFAAIWIWRDKKISQLVLWPIYDKRLC